MRAWLRAASAALVLASTALAACTTSQLGAKPRVEGLASLTVGRSSANDVLLAVGEPGERGVARFLPDQAPREVWFYEYDEIHQGLISSRDEVLVLLVFLDRGRYDGHLWFGGSVQAGMRW